MSIEKSFLNRPVSTRAVLMSGQIRKCPKCGCTAIVKRTVDKIFYVHQGVVKFEGDFMSVKSSSDYHFLLVDGKPKGAAENV